MNTNQEAQFQNWYRASKYCQVVDSTASTEQAARDGFAAGQASVEDRLVKMETALQYIQDRIGPIGTTALNANVSSPTLLAIGRLFIDIKEKADKALT